MKVHFYFYLNQNKHKILLKDEKKKIQINWLVNSRKLLHILMNEEELKLKPLVVLINTLCASNKKEEDIIKDIKEFIKFDDIRTPYKDILLLELNKFDFEPVWQKTLKLILEASKEKN